jgi:hypothetical protein
MRALALGFAIVGLSASNAIAAYTLSSIGSPMVESFDGLPQSTVSNHISSSVGTISNLTGTECDGTKIAGSGTAASALFVSAGGESSSGIHSFGAFNHADRALGSIASSTNTMAFGMQITNGTGATIRVLSISFTQENWRRGTNVNTTAFSYSTNALSTNYLTAGTFTPLAALDLTMAGGTTGVLDGNLAANQVNRSATVSGLNIPDRGSIFLRWQDVDETGNDAGMAVDNFSVTAFVPEPMSVSVISVIATYVGLRRRRAASIS